MNSSSPLPAASSPSFPGYPTLDLEGLVKCLRNRLGLMALIFGGFVAAGFAFLFLVAEKKYESTAVVYVEREQVLNDNIRSVLNDDFSKLDALKSLERSIVSSSVILRVVERLQLTEQAEFLKPKPDGAAYADSEIVEAVRKKVDATLERGTRRIAITVTDTSAIRARDIAQAFVDEFEAHMMEQNLDSTRKATAMLEEQTKLQEKKVTAAEEEIQLFREKHPDLDLERSHVAEKELEQLNTLVSAASNERLRYEAEVQKLDSLDPNDPEAILEIGSYADREDITKLLLRRTEHRATMAKIRRQYEPTHPIYKDFQSELDGHDQEVAEVSRNIGKSIRKRLETAIDHEKNLRDSLREQKLKVISVARVRKQYEALTKKADAANATYDALLARINETVVTEGVKESIIRIEDAPLVAAKPSSPKKKIVLALSGMLGLMTGLGVTLVLFLSDRSIRTRKQIEQTLGLPVIAEIADAPEASDSSLQDSLVVFSAPHSHAAESFRSLRTSLSTLSPRSVLLTSPMTGDGKSFCALNLGLLQAQLGFRTLLIDADFRRPSLSAALAQGRTGPAHQEGALEAKNVCQRTAYPNLFLLSCTPFAPRPGEAMNEEHFASMIWEAYRSFDCVIVDTSPLCLVSDALHLARHVDAVALVIRSGQTQTSQAQRACRELRQLRVPIAGSILNGVEDERISKAYFETYRPQAHHHPTMALPPASAPPSPVPES